MPRMCINLSKTLKNKDATLKLRLQNKEITLYKLIKLPKGILNTKIGRILNIPML